MTMPAGWYTDPVDANVERYWDGAAWGTGPAAVRGQPVRKRADDDRGVSAPLLAADPTPKPSAQILVAGILCLVLGPVFAALFGGLFWAGERYGEGAVTANVLGVLVGIVGLVLVVIGVHRLASGVDHLVRRSADQDARAGSRT